MCVKAFRHWIFSFYLFHAHSFFILLLFFIHCSSRKKEGIFSFVCALDSTETGFFADCVVIVTLFLLSKKLKWKTIVYWCMTKFKCKNGDFLPWLSNEIFKWMKWMWCEWIEKGVHHVKVNPIWAMKSDIKNSSLQWGYFTWQDSFKGFTVKTQKKTEWIKSTVQSKFLVIPHNSLWQLVTF